MMANNKKKSEKSVRKHRFKRLKDSINGQIKMIDKALKKRIERIPQPLGNDVMGRDGLSDRREILVSQLAVLEKEI